MSKEERNLFGYYKIQKVEAEHLKDTPWLVTDDSNFIKRAATYQEALKIIETEIEYWLNFDADKAFEKDGF